MVELLTTSAAVVAGVLLVYVVLLVILWRYSIKHFGSFDFKGAMKLLPDLLILVKRLAFDQNLNKGVRIKLFALLAYLAFPIDLVPDFVPLLGVADDIIITALVLRSVIRSAGQEAVVRHWPGGESGLFVLGLLCGWRERIG